MKKGDKVFIRTVTLYYVGQITKISNGFITLKKASWIADTGRWNDALIKGTLSEVEPYPDWVMVAIGAIVDVTPWNHELPSVQK